MAIKPVMAVTCVFAYFRRIINDSLRTDVSLLYPPYMISLGMMSFLCTLLNSCAVEISLMLLTK